MMDGKDDGIKTIRLFGSALLGEAVFIGGKNKKNYFFLIQVCGSDG